jgi:hypothetical protein
MKEKFANTIEEELELPKELIKYPHFVDENGDIIILLEPRLITQN